MLQEYRVEFFKDEIISNYAQKAVSPIVNKAIREIQSLKGDSMLSGDDSGLRNVWDEICVQVQWDYSAYWDAYESVMEQVVDKLTSSLTENEKKAIWLQTEEAEDWQSFNDDDEEEDFEEFSYSGGGGYITEYIVSLITAEAGSYTNRQIVRFLDQHESF